MQQYGCGQPPLLSLVDAHGLRRQLRDSSYLFLGSMLTLTAPLEKETEMNSWMLLHG
jgi:hypothetical protein